jgi:phage baseplate assembly protein W
MNRSTIMDLYAATAAALRRWEPRLRLTSVKATSSSPGVVVLDLVGIYLPDGRAVTLDGIEVR